jgi:hypothetical protein
MTRTNLQNLAEMRLLESRTLLAAGFPSGAYYLAGYAVECALKACIAKRTREHDFPDKDLANKSYTHSLIVLLPLAHLAEELNKDKAVGINWDIVKSWSEQSRYETKSALDALQLLQAIEDQSGGVLPWVQKHW